MYHNVPLATSCGQRCLGCRTCVEGGGKHCTLTKSGLKQPLCHVRPTPILLGQCWIDRGRTRPELGVQFHHEDLEVALRTETHFTRERWFALRVRGLSDRHYVEVGDRFYRPASTDGAMDLVQWRFIGCTSDTCDKTGCQKQMYGVMLTDDFGCPHYFRFSVTRFGVRTTVNLFHALIVSLIRKYRTREYVLSCGWMMC